MNIDELENIVLAKHRANSLTPTELGEYLLKLLEAAEHGKRKVVHGCIDMPPELVKAMIDALQGISCESE